MRPASFAQTVPYQLSTSQLIGLTSALAVAYFYASFWQEARKNPKLAMSLGDMASIRELRGEEAAAEEAEEEDEGEGEIDEAAEESVEAAPPVARTGKGKKKGLKGKKKPAQPAAAAGDEEDASSPEGADEPNGDPEPGTT